MSYATFSGFENAAYTLAMQLGRSTRMPSKAALRRVFARLQNASEKHGCWPLSMRELVQHLVDGTLPRKFKCVTVVPAPAAPLATDSAAELTLPVHQDNSVCVSTGPFTYRGHNCVLSLFCEPYPGGVSFDYELWIETTDERFHPIGMLDEDDHDAYMEAMLARVHEGGVDHPDFDELIAQALDTYIASIKVAA